MGAAQGQRGARGWKLIDVGTAAVTVAERDALGTTARVAAWPPFRLPKVLDAVDTELALLDEQASRFRDDSEISLAQRCFAAAGPQCWPGGRPPEPPLAHGPVPPSPGRSNTGPGDTTLRGTCIVSEGLAEAIAVALAAAEWTGGLVDPTVGGALAGLGYDRDFAALPQALAGEAAPPPGHVPGWQSVRLDGRRLRMAAGVRLDLGATAKGLGSDRAAGAAAAHLPGGGVLVSLGGDIAVAGEAPSDGWPVLVADEPDPPAPAGAGPQATGPDPGERLGQLVRLATGGLATSSILCRRWQRGGSTLHHIVDPRTGLPAAGPWRTASVAAATCAEANAAATAAIVAGEQAVPWLAAQGLPARLVSHDGGVRLVGGWPATAGGPIEAPASRRMPAAPGQRWGGSRGGLPPGLAGPRGAR